MKAPGKIKLTIYLFLFAGAALFIVLLIREGLPQVSDFYCIKQRCCCVGQAVRNQARCQHSSISQNPHFPFPLVRRASFSNFKSVRARKLRISIMILRV